MSAVSYKRYPNHLDAVACLTNSSAEAVVYAVQDVGLPPIGWLAAQTTRGWTNIELTQLGLRSWRSTLPPHTSDLFVFTLPKDTMRWKCGFSFQRVTPYQRLANPLWKHALSEPAASALEQRALRTALDRKFESALFEINGLLEHDP